ncbi:MAG: hypothetical protein Q8P41_07380 [Pseudomonadota bacterium]|nr:hypothetical protein [Pseudomonadota bacterium]
MPGVFDGQRMSRAHLDEAEDYGSASCARARDGVFAGPEQHVGQFYAGTRPDMHTVAHRSVFARVEVRGIAHRGASFHAPELGCATFLSTATQTRVIAASSA